MLIKYDLGSEVSGSGTLNVGSVFPISVWCGRPPPRQGVTLPRTPKAAPFLMEFAQDSEQCLKSSVHAC